MTKTRRLFAMRIAAVILTASSIYFLAPWKSALYYLSPLPDTIQEQADESVEQGLDGIIIYVDKKGQPPESYASGWHNKEQKIPAFANAIFKIASIGKLYDAAAFTKLVAAGRVSLDDSLAESLPDLAERIANANEITLRMLVQHRSGIPNFTDHEGFSWGENMPNVLDLILDLPADFEPGTQYAYSNSNYLLLQMIMSNILGYDYWQFVESELFIPLSLLDTFYSIYDIESDRLMSGYYVGYEVDLKGLDQGYVATAEDVAGFLRALNDGSLFTPEERDIYHSLYEYEHTGWVLGYLSIARYHRELDTVVVQFINTNGSDDINLLRDITYNRVIDILEQR